MRDGISDIIRLVEGVSGRVALETELVVRYDYGWSTPWVTRQKDGRLDLTAGPDRLMLDTPVKLRGEDFRTVGEFEVEEGQQVSFVMSWRRSFRPRPEPVDPREALKQVERFWTDWTSTFKPAGDWPDAVLRSLLTLKALTHWETGGVVAAATTSLPECLGGERNWDYRYCWLRDAAFTLYALMESGFLVRGRRLARVAVARGRRQPG